MGESSALLHEKLKKGNDVSSGKTSKEESQNVKQNNIIGFLPKSPRPLFLNVPVECEVNLLIAFAAKNF